jgi:hypothetical protein
MSPLASRLSCFCCCQTLLKQLTLCAFSGGSIRL